MGVELVGMSLPQNVKLTQMQVHSLWGVAVLAVLVVALLVWLHLRQKK